MVNVKRFFILLFLSIVIIVSTALLLYILFPFPNTIAMLMAHILEDTIALAIVSFLVLLIAIIGFALVLISDNEYIMVIGSIAIFIAFVILTTIAPKLFNTITSSLQKMVSDFMGRITAPR